MLAQDYSITLACEVMTCPRSSYYYQAQTEQDAGLRAAIESVAATWPTYGSRRIQAQLCRQGHSVSRKRVRRLMREMGLQVRIKRKQKHTTNSHHIFPRYPNLVERLEIVRPDQVWVADITYVHLLWEDVYLAVLMDVFTRAIRGWHLGRNLDQELTLTALRKGLSDRHPEIHHSDQGVQYAASAYAALLQSHHVAISMAEIGAAWQNGYAERLIRTIKEEAIDLSEYRDYQDAYEQIGHFLEDVYMRKRIHSSLGYLTPAEFERQWAAPRQFHDPAGR